MSRPRAHMSRARKVPDGVAEKLIRSADSFVTTFESARMEDIAQASGIPRATLYYYFDGKSEILAFLFHAVLVDFGEKVGLPADDGADTRTRVASIVRGHLELIAANPAVAQLILSNLGQINKLPDMATEVDHWFFAPIRRVLEDGVRRGEVGPIDVATAATSIYASISICALAAVFEGLLDVEVLSKNLTNVLWSGIGS